VLPVGLGNHCVVKPRACVVDFRISLLLNAKIRSLRIRQEEEKAQ
jgi:hypothetical protein